VTLDASLRFAFIYLVTPLLVIQIFHFEKRRNVSRANEKKRDENKPNISEGYYK